MASATTFNFLGFTHVWGRSMQGKYIVRQITAKGRFARALKSVHEWCKRNRHLPIKAQHDYLARAIRGHYAYYGAISALVMARDGDSPLNSIIFRQIANLRGVALFGFVVAARIPAS